MWCASIALLLLLQARAPAADHARGLEYYKQRDYKQATQFFERAVAAESKDSPEYRESVLLLAQSYYLSSRFDKAVPWLEKAALAAGAGVEVSYMLGNAYVLNNEPEKAETAFAKLFGVSRGSPAAQLLTAQMMVRNELWTPAESLLERAVAQDAVLPEAHYLLGIAAIARGEIDRSVKELEKEITVNPNFAMAYYRLGDAYSRRDEVDRAIPQLQRSIWINPNYSGPYILLGKVYFKKQDYVNAEGMLRNALRLDPQNYSAHYLLGQTLIKIGRQEEARKILDKAEGLRRE